LQAFLREIKIGLQVETNFKISLHLETETDFKISLQAANSASQQVELG